MVLSLPTQKRDGFSFIELLVVISILGILSSIALVNLSQTWASERLLASTRELENWLSDQRRFAMRQNLTCKIIIDATNKRLISTIDADDAAEPCSGAPSGPHAGIFDLAQSFGRGSEKLALHSSPSIDPESTEGGIRFSFRGFSQNHELNTEDRLELRLSHRDLSKERCIRIISPIGMMRDGHARNAASDCRYDQAL